MHPLHRLCLLLALLAALPARASLVNQHFDARIDYAAYYGWALYDQAVQTRSGVVGAGYELAGVGFGSAPVYLNIDPTADRIFIDLYTDRYGYTYAPLTLDLRFDNLTDEHFSSLGVSYDSAAYADPVVSYTSQALHLELAGAYPGWYPGGLYQYVLDYRLSPNAAADAAALPEPGSLALALGALGAFALRGRRR